MATSSVTSSVPAGSQISPGDERLYHQSNLIGDWKGSYTKLKGPVEFKVLSIKGGTAQVEYTHNGRTDRGTATVSKNQLTFQNVTVATRDGQKAVIQLDASVTKFNGVLDKDTTSSKKPDGPLVGTWTGTNNNTGDVANFTVKSVNGKEASVSYTVNGISRSGTASVYQNVVRLGNVQITVNPDRSAKIAFTKLAQTLSLDATVVKPAANSTVSKFA